jgi:hypothetical protein
MTNMTSGEQTPMPIGNGKQEAAPIPDTGSTASSGNQATANSVAAIVANAKDGRGGQIDYVYFKREEYAIYRSGQHIVVAYADSRTRADEQIAAISALLPLRDHLINLIKDLPAQSARDNYLAQIADALRLGLEKQSEVAKAIIDEAVRDALEAQARIGRMVYLKWAAGMALTFATVLILWGGMYLESRTGAHFLLMATGAGAVGALLSIAIGIRGRTVAVDGNWQANAMDAAVRVLIGIISAAILFLLLNSGILMDLKAGSVALTGEKIGWQAALLVGFAAGFLERLVPDLLERSAPAKPPTTGGGVASPGVATAGKP